MYACMYTLIEAINLAALVNIPTAPPQARGTLNKCRRVIGVGGQGEQSHTRLMEAKQCMELRRRWFGHAARRPEGELIKDLLRTWRRRTGG